MHASKARSRVVLVIAGALLVVACGPREPERPPPAQAYPYPYANVPPPVYGPAPAPPPQPANVGVQPAVGFPCVSDGDLQCAFGRCVQGRCGGCRQASDCKPGAACIPSVFGASCWPGGANAGAPSPPPPSRPPVLVAPVPAPPVVRAPTANPGDPFAAARDRCVQLTNMYRARVGAPPVARDPATEGCVDRQAAADARRSAAHANFGQCNEFAQNTCPNYPGATVDEVMTRCFEQMFAEGPGGGHYDNMTSRRYTQVFCGFADLGGGTFWVNQDFR